jgi:hypothetical protein
VTAETPSELRNFLVRCRAPRLALGALGFYTSRLARRTVGRILPASARYPASVRAALRDVRGQERAGGTAPVAPPATAVRGPIALALAGREHLFPERPEWDAVFPDPEDTEALHRWNWLLRAPRATGGIDLRTWGLALLRSWIVQMGARREGPAWESYTTGERICNAVVFLARTSEGSESRLDIPSDLAAALTDMACFLARRLEYHGADTTGNHVLNNARALYFAGQALRRPALTRLALAVLRHDAGGLVDRDGFLREGSSHYHFLATRWLLECLWLAARTGERELPEVIEPLARRMVERCWFFLVPGRHAGEWSIPLIGDVSPDVPWEWLLDLPWSVPALGLHAPASVPTPPAEVGWSGLFGRGGQAGSSVPDRAAAPTMQAFAASGWYRLDWGSLTLFWRVEPGGPPASFASHAHCDAGSFCLFWEGAEVVADPGRPNYLAHDPLGRYAASARAHSAIVIDGYEPFVHWRRSRYPRAYRAADVDVRWESGSESASLSIRHTGFARLHGDRIVVERVFRIRREELVIDDAISGRSVRSVETRFQFAPDVEVLGEGPTCFSVKAGRADLRAVLRAKPVDPDDTTVVTACVLRGQTAPTPGGWCFPGYGRAVEAPTLLFEARAALPYRRRYLLRWGA